MNSTENLELYHWGVKGMKWGVRRYQKKDGTLTNAGKKHYSAEMEKLRAESKVIANKKRTAAKMAKLDDLRKKNEAELAELEPKSKKSKKQSPTEPAKKSISQMTDAELQSYKQRLQLEKDTYDLQNKISQLNPPKESAAKKMIENYGPAIAKAVWNDVAKPSLNKYLEQKYKIEKPLDELGKLAKEADIWQKKSSIAENKRKYADNTEKLREGDERRAKREQEKANKNNNSNNTSESKYNDTGSKNNTNKRNSSNGQSSDTSSNTSQQKTERKTETWTGTVEGEGTSRFTGWKNTGAKYYDNARYTEVNVGTAVATRSASTGQQQSNSILNRIGSTSIYMLEDRNGR